MTIDIFSVTGQKGKQLTLSDALFGESVNWGLMHQAVVRQQSNARSSIAHVKTRSEVSGSTRKLFAQKGTGQARRGDIRSPTLRGGGKAFGPRNERNFEKRMPKKMRHAAIRSCLSLMASKGAVIGLESYPDSIKTKTLSDLLKKLPIEHGRKILIVSPAAHKGLTLSARNIPAVKAVTSAHLNPESVLGARHVIFLVDALAEAEKLFGKGTKVANISKKQVPTESTPQIARKPNVSKKRPSSGAEKKAPAKKKPSTKKSS
jgi:large subunit ribosomal protein L4